MFEDLFNLFKLPAEAWNFKLNMLNIGEIFFIALILFYFYRKFIRGTQSEKLVKGIFILLLTWAFSELLIMFDLRIVGVFLKTIVSIVIFSLVVIFQPELRKLLGYLGQTGFMSRSLFNNKKNIPTNRINVVKELVEAIKYCSKARCGCLLVLQKTNQDSLYSEVGTKLNADVSCELILTIFHPNTPLHDGAVVIQDDKIVAAGVLLPLTEDPKLSWRYGTRHRAAIGMSEVSDSACVVVSEETGDVSIAIDGILKKYDDISNLRSDLENILGYNDEPDSNETNLMFNLIKIKKKNNK
ncbi:MAG: diadenylate cyclase CdaA [Candidatus Gastranaerophilales bacterium]|nr:diadenylate cyclase CdaA [Candidatus Gastranaerophilales bacterium]